jgi:hypothetical protein
MFASKRNLLLPPQLMVNPKLIVVVLGREGCVIAVHKEKCG